MPSFFPISTSIVRSVIPAAAGSAALACTALLQVSSIVEPNISALPYNLQQPPYVAPSMSRSTRVSLTSTLSPSFPLFSGLEEPSSPRLLMMLLNVVLFGRNLPR